MRHRCSLLLLCGAGLGLHIASRFVPLSHTPPVRSPRFSAHWMFALDHLPSDDIHALSHFDNYRPNAGSLPLHTHTSEPLHLVARSPSFVRLFRPHWLPSPPIGSLFIDRPPVESLLEVAPNCLATREPGLRQLNVSTWSVEAVALFLDTPHFGNTWQTVVGRNGCRMTEHEKQKELAALYLKLSPARTILLEVSPNLTSHQSSPSHSPPYQR